MSKKTPSKSKANKKGHKIDKSIEDLINDQPQKSIEQSSQQPVRLKKLRKVGKKEEERLIEQKQSMKSQSEEEYEASDESQIEYEKFQNADDNDLKRMQQEENNKKSRKKLKKGEQQIDKFVQKHVDQIKQPKNKAKKSQPTMQMSLQAMFQASSQPKKFQHKQPQKMQAEDESNSQIDEIQLARKKHFAQNQIKKENAGLSEKQAYDLAIKQSLKELNEHKMEEDNIIPLDNYVFGGKAASDQGITQTKNQKKQQPKKPQQKKQPHTDNKKREKSQGKKLKQPKKQRQGPLAALYIVFTGQFEPYTRVQIQQLVHQLGAEVPKSITKKATHLLQGAYVMNSFKRRTDQDVNTTNKSLQAAQKGVTIISFDSLDAFFIQYTGSTLQELMDKYKPKKNFNNLDNYMDIPKPNAVQTSASKTVAMDEEIPAKHGNIPWTQKYKPTSVRQIIGQGKQVEELMNWLQIWEDIHIRGNKREVKGSFNNFLPSGNINSNAALLSGDAGLGKTTAARLVAKHFGYSVVQYNASDARNKKSVELISQGRNNMSFNKIKDEKQMHKTLIIMDQVDGMSSGDRGGIAAIIQMIKKTKVPIICICNDRQSVKIRSLAGHCYDIKFHKPMKNLIVKRLEEIIRKEGGTSTNKALETIVQILQNDIRQILTYLQVIFKGGAHRIDIDTIQQRCGNAKDSSIMLNFFEASKKLMSRTMFLGMNINQRVDLSFVDSEMIPLMIQENYLTACPKKKMTPKEFHMITKATQSFVMADLLDRIIMRNQSYCLMPNKMFLSSVYPCQLVCQNLGYPKFSQWFGKFSSEKKSKRLIKELKYTLNSATSVTSFSVKNTFAPMLFERIYNQLKSADPQFKSLVKFMIHYGLTPAIITQHLTQLQYGERQNLLKSIEASKKTRLTKMYNQMCEEAKLKKDKGKVKAAVEHVKYDPVLGEMQQQNIQQQEAPEGENQDQISDTGVQKKSTKATKAKKKK